ncbi:MAG TPA: hypothetical protein VIH22_08105 [Cyclobacteriaceae bacterium]
MKKVLLLLLIMCLFHEVMSPAAACAAEKFKLWNIDHVDKNEIIACKTITISDAQNTPQGILDLLYKDIRKITRPKILLIKNEVAYVNLEGDSEHITNRSGTTGAWYFGATVVFNLTEFKNIKYVYFVDEGEHFGPGKSERLDYWVLLKPQEKLKYKAEIEDRLNAKNENVVRYVEYLREIGDSKSIDELNDVKRQLRKNDYGGCIMRQDEFEKYLDDTIAVIKQRKHENKRP